MYKKYPYGYKKAINQGKRTRTGIKLNKLRIFVPERV